MKQYIKATIFLFLLVISNVSNAYENKDVYQNVKHLNDLVSIDVVGREITIDQDGQALETFKYIITNKGKKPIKSLHWISVYTANHEILYSQNIPLDFPTPIAANAEQKINLQIPFSRIPDKYRQTFLDTNANIDVYAIDRRVYFADGKSLTER